MSFSRRFPILAFAFAALLRYVVGAWRYVVWTLHGRPVTYAVGKNEFEDKRQIPVRSEKADGKRAALAYARQRTGNPELTWKSARKLMQRWLREEREANGARLGECVPPRTESYTLTETDGVEQKSPEIPDRVTERQRGKVTV